MTAPNQNNDIDRVLFDRDQITRRLDELALEIAADYDGLPLSVIVVANGSIFFAAELLLRLDMDLELDILPVSSYSGAKRGERITERFVEMKIDVRDRHVLVLDDIFDSGMTLEHVNIRLQAHQPKDLKTCVLLLKQCDRSHDRQPDYFGFNVENEFVVGYGLDFDERYRNLPYIGILNAI
jgi:hypoxanthine phosphoribosyltransferase